MCEPTTGLIGPTLESASTPVGKLGAPVCRRDSTTGGVGVGFVVGVAVFVAVAEFFHEFGGGVAQVHRHFAAFVGFDKGAGFVVRVVAGVAFGGYS